MCFPLQPFFDRDWEGFIALSIVQTPEDTRAKSNAIGPQANRNTGTFKITSYQAGALLGSPHGNGKRPLCDRWKGEGIGQRIIF